MPHHQLSDSARETALRAARTMFPHDDFPDEEPYLRFRYQVMRVWQLPPRPLLTGGLALLALAPISAVTPADLPGIIQQMERRLSGRRARRHAGCSP